MGLFFANQKPLTSVRAWTCLAVNLFATPGLGSVMGGRKAAGELQLLFSVAGFCLITGWMLKSIMGSVSSEISGAEPPQVPAWWWQAGVLLFGVAWVWSLATSISLLLEASRKTGRSDLPVPPKLAATAKRTPPPLAPGMGLKPMDPYQISAALATVPAWIRQGENISRRFQFQDFPAAMLFVNQVARVAEEAGHHPDIDIRWNRVTLALSTHDVGGLTEKDFALARLFDQMA